MSVGIGSNIHRWSDDVVEAVKQIRPSVMVVSGDDWGRLAECRSSFPSLVIYRYMTPGNPDNVGVAPEELAEAAWNTIQPHRDLIDAVQVYNEAITTSNVHDQVERELTIVRLLQGHGVPVVSLNAGVGMIEDYQASLLQPLFTESAAVGYHGYVAPAQTTLDTSQQPWFLRRPELLWKLPLGNMILTETGTYGAPFGGLMTPEDYTRLCIQIHEYAIGVGMLGTAIFTLSANEPWRTEQPWELVGTGAVAAVLAEYNRSHTDVPHLTIPQSKPVAVVTQQPQIVIAPATPVTPIIEIERTPEMAFNFKFGFAAKVQELGSAVVTEALSEETYIGADYAYQVCGKNGVPVGKLEYFKPINLVTYTPFGDAR